jgi:hypothetical protein
VTAECPTHIQWTGFNSNFVPVTSVWSISTRMLQTFWNSQSHILLPHLTNLTLLARTAKKSSQFTVTKINCLTVFKEINAVYNENHMKHINVKWKWLLKQVVDIVTNGLYRVNILECKLVPISCLNCLLAVPVKRLVTSSSTGFESRKIPLHLYIGFGFR